MKITLGNILDAAKTEEQKMKALAKIQKEIKKNRLTALICGLVYFLSPFFLLTVFFTLFCVQGNLVFFERLPDIIINILNTYNRWIMSFSEWAVLKKLDDWIMSVEVLPTWIIYLAVIAIAIVVVQSIMIFIAKELIAVFTSRDRSTPLNGTLPQYCKKIYKLAERSYYKDKSEFYAANMIIIIIFFLLLICLLAIDGFFSVEAIGELVLNIIGLVIGGALIGGVLCAVLTLFAIFASNIAARGKMTIDKSDLEKLEKFWAEVDPEKKAEIERQEEERWQRWQEEQKRKEEMDEMLARELSSAKDSATISNEEWWEVVDLIEHMKQEYGEDYFKDL